MAEKDPDKNKSLNEFLRVIESRLKAEQGYRVMFIGR